MKTKASFAVILVLLVASIVTNIFFWQDNQKTKNHLNYLAYDQLFMNFRGGLQAGAGMVASNPPVTGNGSLQFYHSAGASLEVATKQLDSISDFLNRQGVPYVSDVEIRLANVATDFMYAEKTPQKRLDADVKFITQVFQIISTECFPQGKMNVSEIPQAFNQIYALSQ